MRRLASLVLVTGLIFGAATLGTTTDRASAAAASSAGGIADGTFIVTSAGGINPPAVSYSFALQFIGPFAATSDGAYAGCPFATFAAATGPGPLGLINRPGVGEDLLTGVGSVSDFRLDGEPCPGGVQVGSLTGWCSSEPAPMGGLGPAERGGYVRVDGIILFIFNCSVSMNGGAAVPITVTVITSIVPPLYTGQSWGSFYGAFGAAGATAS